MTGPPMHISMDFIAGGQGGAAVRAGGLDHDELMARGGPYAELYEIQAAAYR